MYHNYILNNSAPVFVYNKRSGWPFARGSNLEKYNKYLVFFYLFYLQQCKNVIHANILKIFSTKRKIALSSIGDVGISNGHISLCRFLTNSFRVFHNSFIWLFYQEHTNITNIASIIIFFAYKKLEILIKFYI